MTAIQPETKSSSRRALLAGALGGIGAWAASAVGRAGPAMATDHQAILQGEDNGGSLSTVVRISTATAALQGVSDAGSGISYGVRGRNSSTAGAGVLGVATANSGNSKGVLGTTSSPAGWGVRGEGPGTGVAGVSSGSGAGVIGVSSSGYGVNGVSDTDIGVFGSSEMSIGVYGNSNIQMGVFGISAASNRAATAGQSGGHSTGVLGYSGVGELPLAKARTGVYGYANQDGSAKGIFGESAKGFAGYFAGKVYVSKFQEMPEISAPAAPSANKARVFVRDNGSGKTQLCVRFNTGGVLVIKTQP